MSDQGGSGGAGWQPDPQGRHEYRYWDGSAWTDQVSDGGVVSTDPPGGAPTAPAAGTETVAQPVVGPPTGAAPSGPPTAGLPYVPPPAEKAKGKLPVGILALVGLAVAAVVAALVIFLGGDDDDGGGDLSGTISEDEPFVVETLDLEAGEALRAVVRPSDDLDATLTIAVSAETAATAAFGTFEGTGELDEDEVVEEYGNYYDDLFSGSVDGDLSGDLSAALSDDVDEFTDTLSDEFPVVAEAGVPFGTNNIGGEGDPEGGIFFAPVSGTYSIIVAGRDSEGDFEGEVETAGPDEDFEAFDPDEELDQADYLEALDVQRPFMCDEEFFGDDPADVSETAELLCDDDAFDELLSGDISSDVSDDFTSDFSDDFSTDFSDDFSDFSDDFSSDFSDDLVLGEPEDPSSFIPDYGSDARFDALADTCFAGDLADCDELYRITPVDPSTFSYEGYGATCGGRLDEESPGQCESLG